MSSGSENFQLQRYEHAEIEVRLFLMEACSRVFSHCQPGRGSVPELSYRPKVRHNISPHRVPDINLNKTVQNCLRLVVLYSRMVQARYPVIVVRPVDNACWKAGVVLTEPLEDVITPPIPSSSPGPSSSAMDLSPLPHKPAFAIQELNVLHGLPTPDPTPVEAEFPPSSMPLPATADDDLPKRPISQHQ